jgi:hypothetical protein
MTGGIFMLRDCARGIFVTCNPSTLVERRDLLNRPLTSLEKKIKRYLIS